jgi:hypothetical protein
MSAAWLSEAYEPESILNQITDTKALYAAKPLFV